MWLGKAKTPLQNETVTCKGENPLTEPKRLTFKLITGFPSEDVLRRGENAITERKRSTKRQNRVYGAKMSLAKALTERKRGSLR